MSIEKMAFIDIKGDEKHLDDVLIRCARCGVFQPEHASMLSEYSIGTSTLLRNPYGALQIKISEIAAQLDLPLEYRDSPGGTDPQPNPEEYIQEVHAYLNKLRAEYPKYYQQQRAIGDEVASYTTALEILGHVDQLDVEFQELWANKFLKIRLGRFPTVNLGRLELYDENPFELYKLDSTPEYTWCLYMTAEEYKADIDLMFHTLGFERLEIPDYAQGTATNAMASIQQGLEEQRSKLQETVKTIQTFVARERETFLTVYTRIKFLYSAFDLRKYAVIIREQFHVVGFVLERDQEEFLEQFTALPTVTITGEAATTGGAVPVPVKLKNNWFVRPFEMFVNMYGSPSYDDIDPSPFVAYTYCLLFGMMYGDMGHGLCVLLLGLYLGRKRKMDLGRIMSRIGVSSMFFGFWYGSVFGFETLLDPFFIKVMGLPGKPIHVMSPSTTNTILAVAIGLGAAIILMVIVFNICVGIKHRDFGRAVLSSNGMAGLVFYASVLFAALSSVVGGTSVTSTPYVLGLIVLPLLVIFFREPIVHYLQYRSTASIVHSNADLEQSTKFQEGSINIPELFTTRFLSARFGRLPIDSYKKLTFYQNEPFMIYPIKTDREYIWCIYATAEVSKREMDAIFHDLYFERIYIPDEDIVSNERAEAFIKRCVDAGSSTGETIGDITIAGNKTLYQTIFPQGFGGFVSETIFEMFEVVLSFITNTMSFLRVGGFILVHAGMMEVVFTLSKMVGGGASPVIIIVGNLFVMALEGLIVGIQALRLEFYEIFSRFFDAAGESFRPYTVEYQSNG